MPCRRENHIHRACLSYKANIIRKSMSTSLHQMQRTRAHQNWNKSLKANTGIGGGWGATWRCPLDRLFGRLCLVSKIFSNHSTVCWNEMLELRRNTMYILRIVETAETSFRTVFSREGKVWNTCRLQLSSHSNSFVGLHQCCNQHVL